MGDFLDPSFLVSQLVQSLCPNDLKSLSLAVDLLRSFKFEPCDFTTNTFRERWTEWAESEGKHAEIPLIEKDMTHITKKINRPGALFLLLDHLRGSSPRKRTCHLFEESRFGIPKDFIFVLQGFEGENFKWNSSQNRFVCSQRLSPSLLEPAKRVSEIGCMVRILNEFQELGDSMIQQYIACVVRDIVIRHMNFVSILESSLTSLTLTQLMTYLFSPLIDELRAATIICSTLKQMKAVSLYNVLHLMTSHGDSSVAQVALRMRDKAMECIDKMIRDWASKGEVNDPFSEFFVRCKSDVVIYSNWWHDCYFIATGIVPSTLDETVLQHLFSAGKALNFLRKFAEPVELDIDRSISLDAFVASAFVESNKLMLALVMKDGLFATALDDIHRFALLGRGDFATSFVDENETFKKMRFTTLTRRFIGRTVPELTYKEDSGGAFVYDAKPPLSAIIGPYEIQAYKAVSRVLLRMRRVLQFLLTVEKETLQKRIVCFELWNFANLVYNFFQTQVILKSYSTLKEVVADPDVDFDKLLREHARHTSNIARGCWMSGSGKECRDALYEVLDIIDTLKTPDVSLRELRENFQASLFKFRTVLLSHQVSGRALVNALTKCFRNVFQEL